MTFDMKLGSYRYQTMQYLAAVQDIESALGVDTDVPLFNGRDSVQLSLEARLAMTTEFTGCS